MSKRFQWHTLAHANKPKIDVNTETEWRDNDAAARYIRNREKQKNEKSQLGRPNRTRRPR